MILVLQHFGRQEQFSCGPVGSRLDPKAAWCSPKFQAAKAHSNIVVECRCGHCWKPHLSQSKWRTLQHQKNIQPLRFTMIYLMNPDDMFQVLLSAPALQCRKHLTPRHFHGNFRRVAECIAFRTGSSLLSRKSRIPLQMLQASARFCKHCWSMPREYTRTLSADTLRKSKVH